MYNFIKIKKNGSNGSNGSIVVFSLLILSVMLALTQQLLRSVYVSSSFIRTMVNRERAEILAMGGIKLAIASLQVQEIKKEGLKRGIGKEKEDSTKKFLLRVLPHLNRWQSFELQESVDGIDGQLKICISCENGKINLNKAFDFEKQEFKKEYEIMLKSLEIKGQMAAGEIHSRLVEFFKNRKKKLQDISELHEIKGFENIDIFYKPPKIPTTKKEKYAPKIDLALQDIFTIWSGDAVVEPLMFSDSLCAILGLRRPMANDAEKMKEKFKQLIKSFKPDWGKDWDANWKDIQMVYNEKPKFIKNLAGVFSKQFGPSVYSVLSSGKVGKVEQKLLAIIKKADASISKDQAQPEGVPKKDGSKDTKEVQGLFKIVRVYWL